MSWIARALARKEYEKTQLRYSAAADSGADWGLTLIYNALHDKYGFGRERLEKLVSKWNDVDQQPKGFIQRWRDELAAYGFDARMNERDAQELERMITGRTRDRRMRMYTTDHVAASIIVTMYTLRKEFGFGKKRITDLQRYTHDKFGAVLKSGVPIWEFMKCLSVECAVDYPALRLYEEKFGPVDIYRGNRGKR